MKKLLATLLVIASINALSQQVVIRGSAANTVMDARSGAQYNFYVPRYLDTSVANLAYAPPEGLSGIGIDSCGAIIFTYDINNFWARACNPKRWVRVSDEQILPDDVYSGGNVAWSGVGLDFIETAAIYVLNHVIINSSTTTLTLDPSDPTYDRIDLIGLGPTGPVVITGIPSPSPQEPSYNPQVFIRRAAVLVRAGATTPEIPTEIIYDQNLGTPSEWDASNNGGTIDFAATDFPYHLTLYAKATVLDSSVRIRFIYSDTVHSLTKGSILTFIRLSSIMPANQNLYYQLFNAGVPASPLIPFTGFGMFRNIINQYQPVIIPLPSFGAADIIFDEIRVIPTGGGVFPVTGLDFIQFQSGFNPVVTQRDFGVQDNVSYGNRSFNQLNNQLSIFNGKFGLNTLIPSHTLSIGDESGNSNPMLSLYAASAFDAVIQSHGVAALSLNSATYIETNPSFGAGGGNIVTRLFNGSYVKQSFNSQGVSELGTIGITLADDAISNEFFVKPVASLDPTYLALYGPIKFKGLADQSAPDSFVTIKNNVATRTAISSIVSGSANVNIGSGFRWTVPFTNNVKTLFVTNGIFADSSTNTNGLTLQVDSLGYTTRLRTQKMIDSTIAIINALGKATNLGSGFRLVIPFTNQIKTLFNSYAFNWDSTTNANGLTPTIDTTLMATRAWAQSISGGGGITGVTSVAGSNTNGFSFSIANPTSTPTITLSTTVTGMVKANGTAFSAATSGTDYSAGTSALASGIIKSANGTGGLSIATAGTDYVIPSVTTLASLTTASSLVTVGNITSGGMGTGAVLRGVTMTLGSDASFDTYYRNASGVLTRIPNGTSGQFLGANTGAAPSWQTPSVSGGVASITGTANQVIASAPTGAVTLSLPQSIATTSQVTFQRGTFSGAAATANLILASHTDPAAAAGVFTNNGTRLAFSFATTFKRLAVTNDVAPGNGQIPIGNGTDFTVAAIAPINNTFLVTNTAGGISIGPNMTPQTLADGATITWNGANGYNATVTLAGTGRTLARSNWVAGATYTLRIVQDGSGSRTITTWPTGIRWPNGTAPVLSTSGGAINIVSFYFDGNFVFGAYTNGAYQ